MRHALRATVRARSAALALLGGLLLLVLVLPVGATQAAGTVGAGLPKPQTEPPDGKTPLDLVSASVGQVGTNLRVSLRTAKPFLPKDLVPGTGRSLCVQLRLGGGKVPDEQLCAIADAKAASGLRMRLTHLDTTGRPTGFRDLKDRVVRPDHHTVIAAIPYAGIGLKEGLHAWQAVSHWQNSTRCQPVTPGVAPCPDTLPDAGAIPFRLAVLKVTGCEFKGARQVTRGSGNRIALTFDDGPAAITAQFLDVLEREHVPATFFVVGKEVAGRQALLRRMLADGDMIGNHSWDHSNLGGGGPAAASQISRTNAAIRQATGFTPCLFRPPYGATSSSLVATAGAQSVSTILWDVDPTDWANPGTDAIVSRVLAQAHPGSIVLDHDGGGPRGQTLAALPAIIHEFKRRGYEFVTVNDLLGLKVVRG